MVGKWIRDTSGVGWGCDPENGSSWVINQTVIPQTEVVKYRRDTLRLEVKLEKTHRY